MRQVPGTLLWCKRNKGILFSFLHLVISLKIKFSTFGYVGFTDLSEGFVFFGAGDIHLFYVPMETLFGEKLGLQVIKIGTCNVSYGAYLYVALAV